MWHFASLRFVGPIFFVICGFVIAKASSEFTTSASLQYMLFLLTNESYNALILICTQQKSWFKKTTFMTV